MNKNNLFEIVPFTKEEQEECKKLYTAGLREYVHVGSTRYVLTETYGQHAANIYNMPLRSDDIVVASFPRSGTTWTQELVWLITNDLNFEKAKSVPLMDRYSFLEMCMFANNKAFQFLMKKNADKPGGAQILEKLSIPGYETLANMKSHRFIKTHLPMSLRPPNLLDTCKVVYVARDPRDVAVSYYCFNKENVLLGLTAPFKDFFELLKKDLLLWCPYFEHVKEAWAQRRHPNMLFLFYEDLSKELKGTARRVANFFGKSYSEEQLDQLCDFLSFDNFKNNESVDLKELRDVGMFDTQNKNFIRKGKSGGWREYFEGELALEVQNWIDQNLRDTDLRFPSL